MELAKSRLSSHTYIHNAGNRLAQRRNRATMQSSPAKLSFFDKVKAFTYTAVQEATRLGKNVLPTKLTQDEALNYVVALVSVARGAQFLSEAYRCFGFVLSPPAFKPCYRNIAKLLEPTSELYRAAETVWQSIPQSPLASPNTQSNTTTPTNRSWGETPIPRIPGTFELVSHLQLHSELMVTDSTAEDAVTVHCLAQEIRHELDLIASWLQRVVLVFIGDDISRNLGTLVTLYGRNAVDE